MAHFHITAVFETKGTSQAEAERLAAATFPGLRHPRLHYCEHDTSGGLGPYPPNRSLYFTTIVEFDAEAYTEEKAVELAEDILDRFSTDEIQYLGHGIIPGSQRVRPGERKVGEEEGSAASEMDGGEDERDESRGKGRRSQRGRGRGRKPGRREKENDRGPEERGVDTARETDSEAVVSASSATVAATAEAPQATPPRARAVREAPSPPPPPPVVEEPAPPPSPPPRSSAAMQVTLTVALRASEIAPSDSHISTQEEELIALAVAEARRRHSELPVEVTPDSATSALPGGDRLISLTWRYESPVPSAAE